MNNTVTDFFLSANTPAGFISNFDMIYKLDSSWKCYILKGVPGCGKSTVFKKIAEKAQDKYQNIERIHCSCDPQSLDGVVLHDAHKIYIDGTMPHMVEPLYPGTNHIVVSLYDGINKDYLWEKREDIRELIKQKKSLSENCQRLLSSTGEFYSDTYISAESFTDIPKVQAQSRRIIKQELKNDHYCYGKEYERFFSVITKDGVSLFENTIEALADRVFLLQDDYGLFSHVMLSEIKVNCLYKGYDVISCCCCATPWKKYEHLFIPELKLAFVSSNKFHPLNIVPYRIINSRRYTNNDAVREKKKRLAFNKNSTEQILSKSIDTMGEIYSCHHKLENIYQKGIDFKKTDAVTDYLLSDI